MTTLEQLQTSNRDRLNALAEQGLVLNDLMLLRMRVDALTAIVLAPYPQEAAAEFEKVYEQIVADILDAHESELNDGADETDSDRS